MSRANFKISSLNLIFLPSPILRTCHWFALTYSFSNLPYVPATITKNCFTRWSYSLTPSSDNFQTQLSICLFRFCNEFSLSIQYVPNIMASPPVYFICKPHYRIQQALNRRITSFKKPVNLSSCSEFSYHSFVYQQILRKLGLSSASK